MDLFKHSKYQTTSSFSFHGLQVLFRQSKLYLLTKTLLFLVIILERLYMFLKEETNDSLVYFLIIIAVLFLSFLSEIAFIKYFTRKRIKKNTLRLMLFIHQIITFQALIELTFPMTDLNDEVQNGIIRQDMLFLITLLAIFLDALIVRFAVLIYLLAIFTFRLSETFPNAYYASWAIMTAILLLSGFIFFCSKRKTGIKNPVPDKIQREFENHIEGIAIINQNKQVTLMNGVFKGLLDSNNEDDALEEILRLRKMCSYSERSKRGFMEEIQIDRNNMKTSPLKKIPSLRDKSEGPKFTRARSLKKSFESEKQSAVMFRDSIDNGKSSPIKDPHSYLNVMNTENKGNT